jgi:hypothetical protein
MANDTSVKRFFGDFVRENGSQMFVTLGATSPARLVRMFVSTSATC